MSNRYLFESSRISLKEFCFHSYSGNKLFGNTGKFRDVVDAFRTVYWFHDLRLAIGAKSCYGMESCLEPGGALRVSCKEDASPYRINKWKRYRKGRNTPSLTLVAAVDQQCEGSRICFNHVLWDILRLERPVSSHSEEWIGRLAPEIQNLLWQRSETGRGVRIRRRKLGLRQFSALSRLAGLDALACLTLLLREAHAEGNELYAFELSFWLCRILLMVGTLTFYSHGIAFPLYEFYELAILPLGTCQDLRCTLLGVDFLDLLGLLSHRLSHLEGVDALDLGYQQRCHYLDRILTGDYGHDYFFLCKPIPIPVSMSIDGNHPLQVYSNAANEFRMWALRSIQSCDGERFPPGELLVNSKAAELGLRQYQASKE